jgi:hypothetical protein
MMNRSKKEVEKASLLFLMLSIIGFKQKHMKRNHLIEKVFKA